MKRLLLALIFIPSALFAQQKETCTYDMYNCYLHSLRAFLHGNSGVEAMHKKYVKRKNITLYVKKYYYTSGFPNDIDGYKVQYIDIEGNEKFLYNEQKKGTGILVYMSALNVTAEMCDLWLMPVTMKKTKTGIEADYPENGCHIFFNVCKDNGKLGYARTDCPPNK